MSLFGSKNPRERYGAIIDIGSGSVLIAIVHSDPNETHPQIIWSHREHAPLRNIDSVEQSAKAVMTALINTAMMLDAEGRKALYEYNPKAEIIDLHCNISAPWSYTVTKTINYRREDPFEITDDLIDELLKSIQTKIDTDLKQNEALSELGLQIITRYTMEVAANGYRVINPEGNKANELRISQASAVTQQYLIDSISELQEKIFSRSKAKKTSFILVLYSVTQELLSRQQDVCLVDVTYEATEIGVVRDENLMYCTHTPFGSFSLAREISKIINVPLHEAFGYIHTEKPFAFMDTLPKDQKEDISAVFEAYTERLSALFKETGDALSIPKQIILHADMRSEPLFSSLIEKAVKRNIKTEPFITPISREVIEKTYNQSTDETNAVIPVDTALLLTAQFFHTLPNKKRFEYL